MARRSTCTVVLSSRVDVEDLAALHRVAVDQDTTVSNLVAQLVRERVQRSGSTIPQLERRG
jgi:hypothetical protein